MRETYQKIYTNYICYYLKNPLMPKGKQRFVQALAAYLVLLVLQSINIFHPAIAMVIGTGLTLLSILLSYYYGYLGLAASLAVNGSGAFFLLRAWFQTGQMVTLNTLMVVGCTIVASAVISIQVEKDRKRQERLHYLAYHDVLTDLPNRLLFREQLSEFLKSAEQKGIPTAVMFLDMDGFKRLNDTLGHDQGDELLRLIANRLKNAIRSEERVARFGGDEFMVIIQSPHKSTIHRRCEKILSSLYHSFNIQGQETYVTASAGVAMYPHDGQNTDTLMQNAVTAMSKAKEMGRNTYTFFSLQMKNEIQETMIISNELFQALERNELLVYYQPQVHYPTGEIVGLEALLRWNHHEQSFISPSIFIPIAEQTGLIKPIGDWVLRTACKQSKAWQTLGLPPLRISVNMSAYQLVSPELVDQIKTILKDTGLDSSCLELEITERVLMKDTKTAVSILRSLSNLGIKIALDDFGTEYSSLCYCMSYR